jgi:hypothetical protein
MYYQDNALSDLLLQLESLPGRPSNVDAMYLQTEISIANAEIHRLDVELAIILAKREHFFKRINQCRS